MNTTLVMQNQLREEFRPSTDRWIKFWLKRTSVHALFRRNWIGYFLNVVAFVLHQGAFLIVERCLKADMYTTEWEVQTRSVMFRR